jgi:hypothetical protein
MAAYLVKERCQGRMYFPLLESAQCTKHLYCVHPLRDNHQLSYKCLKNPKNRTLFLDWPILAHTCFSTLERVDILAAMASLNRHKLSHSKSVWVYMTVRRAASVSELR